MSMQDIESMMSSSDFVLDSKYEIENVLVLIQEIEAKAKFFKGLKQYRAKQLDQDVAELEGRAARMREVVLRTMVSTDPKKKTMHFPGTGKVTRRAGKSSWTIKDEKAVLKFLDEQGVKGQVIETKESINKKEASKVFDCFHETQVEIPGVEKKNAAEGISISYEEEKDSSHPSKADPGPLSSSPKQTAVDDISEQDL